MQKCAGASNAEIQTTLKPTETELCKRLKLVNITGKRGCTIPEILTADLKAAIDALLHSCDAAMVNPDNIYVFALASPSSLNHIRGWDAINDNAVRAHVTKQRVRLITSRGLRKYVPTVSQILDMNKSEHEWLSNHLGHSKEVHNILPSSSAYL